MPVVPLQCPLCNGVMQIDTAWADQEVACPLCQGHVTLPPAEMLAGLVPTDDPHFVEPPPVEPPIAPAPVEDALTLGCPICSGQFQVLPSMAGQQVACPHCGMAVTIPPPSAPPEPPAAPPAELPVGTLPVGAVWQGEPQPWEAPAEPTPPSPVASAGLPSSADDKLPPRPRNKPAAPASAQSTIDVDALLPPGASEATSPAPQPAARPVPSEADALLPPGAATADQASLPKTPSSLKPAPLPANTTAPARPIQVPTAEGGFVAIQERPRTIGEGASEVEVRRLSPEEKARRRFRKNAILFAFCLAVLFVVFYIFAR